jgi:DNA repair protein RecO (recombination protein O)
VTEGPRRAQLAPGYLLHQLPYQDTGRILEVFTRDHGRLSLFARGVRGLSTGPRPRASLAAVLQPFQLLLLSFGGRGEAATLTAAEVPAYEPPVPGGSLMGAFYLSELVLKLTTRHDPSPEIFEAYRDALGALRAGPLEPALRIFEKRLLAALGYGLDLTSEAGSGAPVAAHAHYHFRPGHGLVAVAPDTAGAVSGASLLALDREELGGSGVLEDARRVLRTALAECLEGRPLKTRAVAVSVRRQRGGRREMDK